MRVREGVFVLLVTAALLLVVLPRAGTAGAGGGSVGTDDSGDAGAVRGAGASPGGTEASGASEARGATEAAGATEATGATEAPGTTRESDAGDAGAAAGRRMGDGTGRAPADRGTEAPPRPGASASPSASPSPAAAPARVDTLARAVPLGEIFFPPNTNALSADARRRLDVAAREYRAAGSESRPLLLTGHADLRGDPAVNARISRARAEAVAEYLVSRGVPPERIEVRYAGASRPMASGRSPEANASNRRVVVEMLPERGRP